MRKAFLIAILGVALEFGFALHCVAEELKDQVDTELKLAVTNSLPKLGELESWQKTLFSEEVVPQFQRFIRNYQADGKNMKVDLDQSSIKSYLWFNSIRVSKGQIPKILVFLNKDSSCTKCQDEGLAVKTLVRAFLERRGFAVEWQNPKELEGQTSGVTYDDSLTALAKQKKAIGSLTVQLSPVAADDLDTAHADDKRFLVYISLNIFDSVNLNRQKEILDNESFKVTLTRLWTDLMTELGSKQEGDHSAGIESGKEECLIEATGIKEFKQLNELRNSLQNQLKEVGTLVDREVSKQKFVFVVYTKKNKEEVKKILLNLHLEQGALGAISLNVL